MGRKGGGEERKKNKRITFFGIFFSTDFVVVFLFCLFFLFTITNKHNMCEVVLATNIAKSVFWGVIFFCMNL